MSRDFIKFIAVGDIHSESKYLKLLYPLIQDFKPDYFIIAGDFFNFDAISSYSSHRRNAIGINQCIKETREELEIGLKILNELDKILPSKTHKIFIKGNHDIRYDKFCEYEYPQFGPKKLEEALNLKEKKWQIIQLGGFFKLGKLYFMHGERFNSDLFAKNAAIKLRKNIRLWHNHTNQSYTITSPIDSNDVYECKAVGCLCDRDPKYLKGITNRWINSFLIGYVNKKTGIFQDYVVNIIKSKIIFNGKVYK